VIDLGGGQPHFRAAFRSTALLVVEDGFIVVRATSSPLERTMITFEAGPGAVFLPPGPDEVLTALGNARVTAISPETTSQLLSIPGVARRIVEQLALALRHRQGALAIFAPTHHIERVRRKLLQLARTHGHVVSGGIRIDFPISHALLAEMIGSSRETVTRAIDELQRRDFVDRTGSTYRLLVPPGAVSAFGDDEV
jgi:CRP-like cAMP-binding protein